MCWVPGFEEFKVATYAPGRLEGVGLTCRQLEHADFGSIALQNGKTLIKALEFISKLLP